MHLQAEEKAKAESPPRSPDSAAIVNLARALEEGSLSKDPFMQEYRAKRLEEMKQQAKLGSKRFVSKDLRNLTHN